jgi:ATP-binding cassette, subfamily C (CFTR/MRP), member 1
VPQEPVFLPDGTPFQANLDPFNFSTGAECRAILETVGLWASVEERGGLAAGMSADTFSQGQKQLFSLARAILRKKARSKQAVAEFGEKGRNAGGILLLDEFSSSVDKHTDKIMQKIIQEEFHAYTIIMVTHRLHMVLGFDKVIILDKGAVIETGIPRELVETEGSKFKELWVVGNNATG